MTPSRLTQIKRPGGKLKCRKSTELCLKQSLKYSRLNQATQKRIKELKTTKTKRYTKQPIIQLPVGIAAHSVILVHPSYTTQNVTTPNRKTVPIPSWMYFVS